MNKRPDLDEKDFLHDIAGPVNTLGILLEVLEEEVEKTPSSIEPLLKVLKKTLDAQKKLEGLITERRRTLKDKE